MNNHAQHIAIVADTVSAAAIFGVFMGWLPDVAAVGAIIWYSLQIYESKTVQGWLAARRHKKNRHKTH